MVVGLRRRNATPAQLLALGNLVESDVVAGIRPDEAAAFRLRRIEGGSILSGGKVEGAAPAPWAQTPTSQSPPPQRTAGRRHSSPAPWRAACLSSTSARRPPPH